MPDITPSLFIGLGGTGHLFTTTIKRIIQDEHLHSDDPFPLCQYLVIDTEFVSIPTEEVRDLQLSGDEEKFIEKQARADRTFETGTKSRIREYEKVDISMLPGRLNELLQDPTLIGGGDFIPSSASSIKPGNFGASQVGLLGKLMGVAHFHEIKAKIEEVIARFTGAAIDAELTSAWPGYFRNPHTNLAVYIACSSGGGTGRGLCLLVASIVRAALREISERVAQEAVITVLNFMPSCFQLQGRKVLPETLSPLRANTYAAFKELEHVFSSEDPTGGLGSIDMEPFFKHHFGWPRDRPMFVRPIDSVLLLSPKLDGGGAKIQLDSYEQVNEIAARSLTSLIFGGKEGPILGVLSNVRPPAIEAKTKTPRSCRFGRMGRGTMRYPVQRLAQYTFWHLAYHALLDLEDGHLTDPPQDRIDSVAGKQLEPIKIHIAKAFSPPEPVAFSSLGIGEITFETPIVDDLRAKFGARLQSMQQNHESAEARMLVGEDRTKSYLTEQAEEIRGRLVELIEPHGINRALMFVDKLLNYVNQFQVSALEQFELESEQALREHIEQLGELATQFIDGSHPGYKNVSTCLRADRDAWQRANKGLLKTFGVLPERPRTVSDATREATKELIDDFHENMALRLHLARRLETQLEFFNRYRDALIKYRALLGTASSILTNKDQWGRDLGLVAQYESMMERCARKPRDPMEVYVYGRSPQEYADFCAQLPNRVAMFDAVQHELNTHIVPIIVDLDRTLSADELRDVLHAEVKRQVERELAGESITNFLQHLMARGDSDQVNRFWTDLDKQSAWLGTVDSTRIRSDEAAAKDFKRFTFIELQDATAIEASDAARRYFGSATRMIDDNLRETIVISRYQFHMPLFVHDSAWDQLASEYERLVRSHDNQDQAQAALARYHTSRQFFYLNEPFDRVSLIPDAEREHTFNLMLHLGIFSSDEQGYLECLQRKSGREGFEMRRWLTDRDKVDENQAVMFETFAANPSLHADLTEHLLERTSSLLSHMARTKSLNDLLSAYLTQFERPERFPLVPETLLQNRLLRDPNFKSRYKDALAMGYRRKLAIVGGQDKPPRYESVDIMIDDGYVDPRPLWTQFHRRGTSAALAPTPSTIGTKRPNGSNGARHNNGASNNGEPEDDATVMGHHPKEATAGEPGAYTASLLPSESMALLKVLRKLRNDQIITKPMYEAKVAELLTNGDAGSAEAVPLLEALQELEQLQREGVLPADRYSSLVQNFFFVPATEHGAP